MPVMSDVTRDEFERLAERVGRLETATAPRAYLDARFDQVDARFDAVSRQIITLQGAVLNAVTAAPGSPRCSHRSARRPITGATDREVARATDLSHNAVQRTVKPA